MRTDRRILSGKFFGPIMCLREKKKQKRVTNTVARVKNLIVM